MTDDVNDNERGTLELRPLRREDYDAVVALQLKCFPTMQPWSRAQFDSQLAIFPEGQFGIDAGGDLVATSASLMLDYAEYTDWHDWPEICDEGFIRNHDPDGNTLYGIEMQVDPDWRGRRLSRRLYDARKVLCRDRNLERMVIGGRIPLYATHKDEMTAQDYVGEVIARRIIDPVLTPQISAGFQVKRVVSDYLPADEDSAGHGTILEWVNTEYVPGGPRHRRAVNMVRVSLVQYQMRRVESFEDFRRQIETYVDTASDYRSDFLLFPELVSTQLLSLIEPTEPAAQARALAGYADAYREMFRDLAMRYAVNIIGGSTFVIEDGLLYNVAFLFHRNGLVDTQKKLHVTPSERRWWGVQGGNELHVFQTDRGPIGILICYDVEFPEPVRLLAERGVSLLFVPFNTSDRHGMLRVRTCAHARCVENHLYAVIAGCTGHLPSVQNADLHYAESAVLTPFDVGFPHDGYAAKTAPAIEELIVQDLDLEQLRRHRAHGTVRNFRERRSDLYEVVWKGR